MFSELVDDVMSITGRRDRQSSIISYANQTLREIQSHRNGAFSRDLIEDQVPSTVQPGSDPTQPQSIIWTRPVNFRKLRTVMIRQTGFEDIFPDFKQPGKVQEDDISNGYEYYYAADDYFVFANTAVGATLNLAYYRFFRRFQYYAASQRPAIYNRETQLWSYPLGASTDSDQAAARDLVSCWVLLDYYDLVLEGTLTKTWKNVGDARSGLSYSLYENGKKDLVANEAWATLDM